MTNFMINSRSDAWITEVNFLNLYMKFAEMKILSKSYTLFCRIGQVRNNPVGFGILYAVIAVPQKNFPFFHPTDQLQLHISCNSLKCARFLAAVHRENEPGEEQRPPRDARERQNRASLLPQTPLTQTLKVYNKWEKCRFTNGLKTKISYFIDGPNVPFWRVSPIDCVNFL